VKQVWFFALCLLLLSGIQTGDADDDVDVWNALQRGGLVVLIRHASTGKGDPLIRDPSCHGEQNLSDQGKREAAMIGEVFAAKGIRIANVLTSPYCRAIDTARIAFGGSQSAEFLSLTEALPLKQAEENTTILLQRIGSFSGNSNLVLVTHRPNIGAVSRETIGAGAFLVLRPKGADKFEELGKIKLGTVTFPN